MSSEARRSLQDLRRELEEESLDAQVLRPRYVKLDQYMPINDEEVDRAGEIELDETITLNEMRESTKNLPYSSEVKPISAVDTSSVRLGETDRGILSALRIAIIVHELDKEPVYERFGPYIVHLTEGNKHKIYNFFRTQFFNLDPLKESETPQLIKMTDRIRNFLERIAQQIAASAIDRGIALLDGSLTGGTIDTPKGMLKKAVDIAHSHSNSVVAISKKSWLQTVEGKKLIDLLEADARPCYTDIHNQIDTRSAERFLGRVFVVKFTSDGFAFRVDVSPSRGETPLETLPSLAASCSFYNGYPEPLRQAHIHTYFTANEVLAYQAYAIERYKLETIRSFDIRKHLLAPFG